MEVEKQVQNLRLEDVLPNRFVVNNPSTILHTLKIINVT